MNRKEDKFFFLNKVSRLTEENGDYSVYTIYPEYGEGTFSLFRLTREIYLLVNKFKLNNNAITNDASEYEKFFGTIFKIDYCLKGKAFGVNKNGKICTINEGYSIYCLINQEVRNMELLEEWYKSVSIIGDYEDIIKFFQNEFSVNQSKFEKVCKIITKKNEFFVAKTDSVIKKLISEIIEAYEMKNDNIIRLRAYELFLYEMNSIEKKISNRREYFSRSTIEKIDQIKRYIDENLDQKLSIANLCERFEISRDLLKRCFKHTYGNAVYSYIKEERLKLGRELLHNENIKIIEIALSCGYENHHSFSKAFKKYYSLSPREVRRNSG